MELRTEGRGGKLALRTPRRRGEGHAGVTGGGDGDTGQEEREEGDEEGEGGGDGEGDSDGGLYGGGSGLVAGGLGLGSADVGKSDKGKVRRGRVPEKAARDRKLWAGGSDSGCQDKMARQD